VVDLPHFKHINRIPIIDVAKKIGWEVEIEKIGKKIVEKIVCPRSSEHKPGKSPYLKVLASNSKVVCESCDTYPLSVLDMVLKFGAFETMADAAEQIAGYYPDLPRKSKASYLKNPKGESVPPGCRNPWTLLITSGVFAQLTVAAQRLIPILLEFSNWKDNAEEHRLYLPQRTMMRYSGIASFTGISEALTELAAIGFLQRLPVRRRERSPERETAEYILTPLSPRLREFADATATNLGAAIVQEKKIQRQKRRERDYKRMWPSLARDS
jgi:DNA-binding HxlR family transcriptional regulator